MVDSDAQHEENDERKVSLLVGTFDMKKYVLEAREIFSQLKLKTIVYFHLQFTISLYTFSYCFSIKFSSHTHTHTTKFPLNQNDISGNVRV